MGRKKGERRGANRHDRPHAEATQERAELENAPQAFADQRQALIGEIETADPDAAAPPIGWRSPRRGGGRQGGAWRARMLGEARAEAARAEECCAGAAAPRRYRARDPRLLHASR